MIEVKQPERLAWVLVDGGSWDVVIVVLYSVPRTRSNGAAEVRFRSRDENTFSGVFPTTVSPRSNF